MVIIENWIFFRMLKMWLRMMNRLLLNCMYPSIGMMMILLMICLLMSNRSMVFQNCMYIMWNLGKICRYINGMLLWRMIMMIVIRGSKGMGCYHWHWERMNWTNIWERKSSGYYSTGSIWEEIEDWFVLK